jgi:hypothetical protein
MVVFLRVRQNFIVPSADREEIADRMRCSRFADYRAATKLRWSDSTRVVQLANAELVRCADRRRGADEKDGRGRCRGKSGLV